MRKSLLFFLALGLFLFSCRENREITEKPERISVFIDYAAEGGEFELPVRGASGYAGIVLPVYANPVINANIIALLNPGQGFTILEEDNAWWNIDIQGNRGWVMHKFCFINLPDIIPSIVYNNTNTYSSMFRSSGEDIPNITGRALYSARDFNVRLGREEFIAPVLYSMAGKIFTAQQLALSEGNTLIIFEAFRPAEAHNLLHEYFSIMVENYPHIREGITAENFNIRWFLAEAPYNHQRGTAIDASLGRVTDWEFRTSGSYMYVHINGYMEYSMQTPMHELSVNSAILSSRVNSRSTTSWMEFEILESATLGTQLLFRYCTEAGLTPLSSEWWHYNDLISTDVAVEADINGEFHIRRSYSRPPLL